MGNDDLLFTIIIAIIVAIALFFIFRELFCWYYKINKRTKLLERNNQLLEKLLIHQGVNIYSPTPRMKITVKHKHTGNVSTTETNSWEDFRANYPEDDFEIVE